MCTMTLSVESSNCHVVVFSHLIYRQQIGGYEQRASSFELKIGNDAQEQPSSVMLVARTDENEKTNRREGTQKEAHIETGNVTWHCCTASTNGALAAFNNTADCSVRVGCSSPCHLASFNHCEPGATYFNVVGMLVVQNSALGDYK